MQAQELYEPYLSHFVLKQVKKLTIEGVNEITISLIAQNLWLQFQNASFTQQPKRIKNTFKMRIYNSVNKLEVLQEVTQSVKTSPKYNTQYKTILLTTENQ